MAGFFSVSADGDNNPETNNFEVGAHTYIYNFIGWFFNEEPGMSSVQNPWLTFHEIVIGSHIEIFIMIHYNPIYRTE